MVRMAGWLALAGTMCLAGCAGTDGDREEKPEKKAKVVLVGRVASMPAGRGFVLIQSYGSWAVPAGSPVFSCGDCEEGGRLANLLPSGERMGQFVAADVRSGTVEIGDAVYFRPSKEEKMTPEARRADDPEKAGGPTTGDAGEKKPAEEVKTGSEGVN
jgi:hypothetical protein